MLVASAVAGWILPRFFGDKIWQTVQTSLSSHFESPFSNLESWDTILHAGFSFFKPSLVCIGVVAVFSFSSLNCLITDGILIYLGMRTGCALSVLHCFSREITPVFYHPNSLACFVFVLFQLLFIVFFTVYAIEMAKISYRMRIYSVQGRTLFHPKTVMEWLLKTLLCILGLFIFHVLYGYSIYLVSK